MDKYGVCTTSMGDYPCNCRLCNKTNKLVYLCSDCLTKVNEWKAISLYPKTHVCLPIPSLTKMEVNAGKLFAFCHLKALAKDTVSN